MQTEIILEAQIRKRDDGTVAILGESGHVVFGGLYADFVWSDYQKALKGKPEKVEFRVLLDIEAMEPY